MNLNLAAVNGSLLVISQFTLYADLKSRRPGFSHAAKPDLAIPLYEQFLAECEARGFHVEHGAFGADMQVASVNDGPDVYKRQESLAAALLHDCIEDTPITHEDLVREFTPAIADLVEGVTKLTRINYVSMEEKQMENLRKMLVAMNKDIRVILVKLCDRLHNMRTMQYQSPKKQREKSRETLEIYAPIAHRLGMQRLKWELEDLSLRYLDPFGYREIEEELTARSQQHQTFMVSTLSLIHI